jgi:hypothetical protein
VTVNLPFIESKYTGPPVYFVGGVETHPGPLDDGTYHGAFQDLRVEVRRLFWAGPIPVAPFIGASFPTHDYETVGEAVPGRHRRDLQIGANVGVNLDRLLAGAYVHGRYWIRDRPADRGVRVHSQQCRRRDRRPNSVTLRAPRACRLADPHQGPSVQELTVDWEHHDRFIAPSYTTLGVGASVPIGGVDVYALWLGTVQGQQWRPPRANNRRWRTFAFGSRLTWAGQSFCDSAGGAPSVRRPFRSPLTPSGFGTSRRRNQRESDRRRAGGADS